MPKPNQGVIQTIIIIIINGSKVEIIRLFIIGHVSLAQIEGSVDKCMLNKISGSITPRLFYLFFLRNCATESIFCSEF